MKKRKIKKYLIIRLIIALLIFLIVSKKSLAIEKKDPDAWSFEIAPYIWGAAIDGKLSLPISTTIADLDISFSDIVDNLDFGLMFTTNLHKGRWGVLSDIVYMDLDTGDKTLLGGNGISRVKITMGTLTLGGSFSPFYNETKRFEIFAGGRAWYMKNKLKLTLNNLGRTFRYEDTEAWVSPIVGIRNKIDLGKRFYWSLWFDYGGFDSGADSDWQVFNGIGFRFTKKTSMRIGYRKISVDYEKEGFLYDADTEGPFVSVNIEFGP